MKKLFIFMFISFLALPLFAADGGMGLTVGVDYLSQSLWRGIPDFPKGGAFSPYVSYEAADIGLSVTLAGLISDSYILDKDKTCRDISELDLDVEYSNNLGFATLGAGIGYYKIGPYKKLGKLKKEEYAYSTGFVSLTFEDIILSPMLKYSHDYYHTDGFSNKGKDFYIQLGISHTFDIAADVAGLTLGAVGGYFNSKVWDMKGISDIDLSADLEVKDGAVTYSAGFHYVIVPTKDFYYATGELDYVRLKPVKDRNRFYATFGAAYSF